MLALEAADLPNPVVHVSDDFTMRVTGIGEKVEGIDIDGTDLVGVVVTQEQGQIGHRLKRDRHGLQRLAALIECLHDGADADGDQKCDDQHRNRAPEQGLGRQQPPIRRFGDRLREALYGIRVCRRTRQAGARHRSLRSENSPTSDSEGCADTYRITWRFESMVADLSRVKESNV